MHRTPKLPRRLSLLLLPLAWLAGCQTPPPEAYVGRAQAEGDGVAIGRDAAGEVCRQYVQPGGGADIYCGTWKQPAARVRPVADSRRAGRTGQPCSPPRWRRVWSIAARRSR